MPLTKNFVTQFIKATGIFGDGSDGAITVNANPFTGGGGKIVANVMQSDIHATTLTVNATRELITNGFRIYSTVEIVNEGTIKPVATPGAGGAGGNDGSSGSEGSIAVDGPLRWPSGVSGGSGGNDGDGNPPDAVRDYFWDIPAQPAGSAGGDAGDNTGGAGSSVDANPRPRGDFFATLWEVQAMFDKADQIDLESGQAGAGGGGAGDVATSTGGGGGGSGAQGGWLLASARRISGSGTFSAVGGAGGNGGNGSNTGAGAAGGGGGGNGGEGGKAIFVARDYAFAGSVTVTGGAAGAGGTGIATGSNGTNGTAGNTGQTLVIDL